MQLKIILNRLQKHSAFVYETVRLVEHPRLTLEVRVRPRAGTRATCSQCRRRAPGYDTQAVRRFDFVPLWHIPVVFLYAMRRVSCPRCGVRVEAVPWATGKHRLTDAYLPRPLVHPDDALAARPDEGGCPHGALAPRPDSELVPSPGAVLQWRCRRLQRKGQSDHQTGVWLPHLRGTGSRFVSRTWQPARTGTHPQILLTRLVVVVVDNRPTRASGMGQRV